MNDLMSHARLLSLTGALFCLPIGFSFAADSNSAPEQPASTATAPAPAQEKTAPASASSAQPASAKLPNGAAEVVKLSRAQVSEEVIVSYVQNSGSTYSLSSDDIVRLRNEGVSDRIVNTMLDHHKKALEAAQAATAAEPVYAQNDANAPAPEATQPAPNCAQPVSAPLQPAPASSVYVIPYPQATAAYYGYPYRPYYYSPYCYAPPYYGYYGGPVISFGFGFGGGYRHFHHRWR